MEQKSFFSTLKDVIIKFWFVFPILYALFAFVLILLINMNSLPAVIENSVGILLLITLITLPVSWIVLLVNKKWWRCIASFVASVVIAVLSGGALFFMALAAMFGPDTSTFGKDHPIPADLEYNLPIQSYQWDDSLAASVYVDPNSVVAVDTLNTDSYLQIWDGSQQGIYNYDFYYGPLPAGEIYLKCFEVTENIPLSDYRLKKASMVKIKGTSKFSKLVDKQRFTIYEGVWSDYYAARIEVWFKDAETGDEKKLMEKVYRVEGWMR